MYIQNNVLAWDAELLRTVNGVPIIGIISDIFVAPHLRKYLIFHRCNVLVQFLPVNKK